MTVVDRVDRVDSSRNPWLSITATGGDGHSTCHCQLYLVVKALVAMPMIGDYNVGIEWLWQLRLVFDTASVIDIYSRWWKWLMHCPWLTVMVDVGHSIFTTRFVVTVLCAVPVMNNSMRWQHWHRAWDWQWVAVNVGHSSYDWQFYVLVTALCDIPVTENYSRW